MKRGVSRGPSQETINKAYLYLKKCHDLAVEGIKFDPYRMATEYKVSKGYFGAAIRKQFFERIAMGLYKTPVLDFTPYEARLVVLETNKHQIPLTRQNKERKNKEHNKMSNYSDNQLFNELKLRGYTGRLSKGFEI